MNALRTGLYIVLCFAVASCGQNHPVGNVCDADYMGNDLLVPDAGVAERSFSLCVGHYAYPQAASRLSAYDIAASAVNACEAELSAVVTELESRIGHPLPDKRSYILSRNAAMMVEAERFVQQIRQERCHHSS